MSATAGKVLIIPKGEYSASTQYKMLDMVYYEGCSYICKQTTTGHAPPTDAISDSYWMKIADKVAVDSLSVVNGRLCQTYKKEV